MNKLLGHRIKLFRTRKELSRKYLSQELGISVHTLTKYEQAQREPNIQTLTKISNLLGISLDTLTCSEFFGYEILCRATQMTLKQYGPPDNINPFVLLDNYADHDILLSFYNNNSRSDDLPSECIKGILDCINDYSKEDFNKIYNDLVATDVYNLNSKIKDYCQQLYTKIMPPINSISNEDYKSPISDEYSDSICDENLSLLGDDIPSLDYLDTSYLCKENLANLIKYKIKDFDLNTLCDEDFNAMIKNTLDFIEYQIYKIKNKKNDAEF